jgi:hypothetical protein
MMYPEERNVVMKKLSCGILLGLLLMVAGSARADVSVGATIDENGIRQFHLAIGTFYNVPERAVTVIKKKGVSDEELAVVFFISERAGVKPAAVIDLRQLGKSWLDITVHFGLSPEIYYVAVKGDPGPPYGKAYGYFKKHPRSKWREIVLSDVEVVDLVNLRMVSKLYGVEPDEVIKWRAAGKHFTEVNLNAKEHRDKAKAEAKAAKSKGSKARAEADNNGKGENKGKK